MTDPTTESERTPGDIANHLAREIKRRRLDAGLSQRGLATATGYTRQYVSMTEWEDANLPSQELIAAIDTAVGANGDLVAIRAEAKSLRYQSRRRSDPVAAEPESDSAGSARLPVLIAAELGSDRAFEFGSATSLMRSRAVSERSLGSFAALTNLLAGQRQSIAPDALIGPIEAHRDAVAALFRAATDDRSKQRAGALLGETSVVASRVWSAIGDRSMALTHCAFARKLADQLQDKTMGGIARIFESNLRSDAATLISSDGDVVIGLRILKEAANVSDLLPPAARARIGAEQAQAYAVLELREECEEALVRAQRAAEDIDENDRAGLFSDWNTTRIQVYVGTCQLLLGQPKRAIAALTEALTTPEGDSPNVDLAARVDLASAYALSGELEEGCRILGDTYNALATMGNHRGLERAQRAIERMAPWHDERPVLAMRERVDSINGY
ncbi:helix-turn-helix domain-containing protein [Nocardia halotolerans]|uniref:Helix-turn-helix domain-containing protein n=1 Tax=Nocardia halotolerans TaxID=1755878 RepID=A0ABV8VI75_9NOCA